jgi:hypothetical protein
MSRRFCFAVGVKLKRRVVKMRLLIGVLIVSCLSLGGACAQVVYVDKDAPGPSHDGTSWDTAYLTIQAGVDEAGGSGEDVWVADGVYPENLLFDQPVAAYAGFLGAEPGGYETQLSERDFETHIATIDGGQNGSAVVCSADATIDGFHITGGTGTRGEGFLRFGGGVHCVDCSPTVRNCRIESNYATHGGGVSCWGSGCFAVIAENSFVSNDVMLDGGAIYCYMSAPSVENNRIIGNTGDYSASIDADYQSTPLIQGNWFESNYATSYAGGVTTYWSSPRIVANVFVENSAAKAGGGVYAYGHYPEGGPTLVEGNLFVRNDSPSGGAIGCRDSDLQVVNNTIVFNTAASGAGIWLERDSDALAANNIVVENSASESGGGIWIEEGVAQATLEYNDFWSNTPQDYFGTAPGETDFSADPLFSDPEHDDYRLTCASPCIDSGDPDSESPDGTRIDLGYCQFGGRVEAPDPEPECDGALFGEPQRGYPGWVWFSIPFDACGSEDPSSVLGFDCSGAVWRWDRYGKFGEVYRPPFVEWDLTPGESFLLYLTGPVETPSYMGSNPEKPCEFRLGRAGWTWVGMPRNVPLAGSDFMANVLVRYPSTESGEVRTAQEDRSSFPANWVSWGWSFFDTYLQAPKTFTPYLPFGNTDCYPWLGYRVWVCVGSAIDEDDPDQVTLIWP